MWILCAVGSAFFAGVTAILAKCGLKNVNSHLATAVRTVVVLAFSWLMVFVVGSQGELATIDKTAIIFLAVSGLFTGASWLCYFKALQMGNVNVVTPIDKSSTVMTMLLALIFLGEGVTWLKGLAMALIAVGTLLMVVKQNEIQGQVKGKSYLLYALGSAVFASLTAIFSKIGIEHIDSTLGTAIRTVVVLVMAWVMVFATNKQGELSKIDGKSWLFLLLSGLATGASWLCYFSALQSGDASVVVPIDKLSIVLTVAFSCLVLKEGITKKALLGLALIVSGTMLMVV